MALVLVSRQTGQPLLVCAALALMACSSSNTGEPPPDAGITPNTQGWWRDKVFYEIFVRSFADSNGDGVGDLAGLTAHVDALNDGDAGTGDDLEVDAVWLMPINPSPSYHGYDVLDYRDVNAQLRLARGPRRLRGRGTPPRGEGHPRHGAEPLGAPAPVVHQLADRSRRREARLVRVAPGRPGVAPAVRLRPDLVQPRRRLLLRRLRRRDAGPEPRQRRRRGPSWWTR